MPPLITVEHVWKCAACRREHRQKFDVPAGLQVHPPERIEPPSGWAVHDGEPYCDEHSVRCYTKVTNLGAPHPKSAA